MAVCGASPTVPEEIARKPVFGGASRSGNWPLMRMFEDQICMVVGVADIGSGVGGGHGDGVAGVPGGFV